jgi:hypothetical protein
VQLLKERQLLTELDRFLESVARAKQQGLHIELLAVDKLMEYEEEAKQGKIL